MSPKDFVDYIDQLSDAQFEQLIADRLTRLNPEQQKIAVSRQLINKKRMQILNKLKEPNVSEDTFELVFDQLRDLDNIDECEHQISLIDHCQDCGQIDYLMFPELFDPNGLKKG